MGSVPSTAQIRIWRGLKEIIQQVSYEHGYIMSDFASAILLEALRNEHLIFYALVKWFDIPLEEALETAKRVASLVRTIIAIEEEEEEELEEVEAESVEER
jgi:hypothetical protein